MTSSSPAISVQGLSKAYRLGVFGRHTLVDELQYAWHRLRGRDPRTHMGRIGAGAHPAVSRAGEDGLFWALRDVSFDVRPGEVLGIIGRNGAGKSTLLKLLTRITEPTEGRAVLEGRVASLLEVGTGFHPELTGRENVYLNGTFLGMKKREIDAQFDAIVDFAEVEQFIDTPVKRYSSGMYVRLAFAVAAHLEPEILLVDEVLAVGDVQFQKKCLGKMSEVAREGRTILFVSHNMAAVQQLCARGVVLSDGRVQMIGSARDAVRFYADQAGGAGEAESLEQRTGRKGSQWLKFTKVEILDESDAGIGTVLAGQNVRIRLHYRAGGDKRQARVQVAFNVKNSQGQCLANLNSNDTGLEEMDLRAQGYFECDWPRFQLRAGRYDCDLFCTVNQEIADWVENAFVLEVVDGDYYGTGRLIARNQGEFLIDHRWRHSGRQG